MFGKKRVMEVIKTANSQPRALIGRMTQAVADFTGDTEQSDDLTMLAMQWKKVDQQKK
jgi:sigma-B regulation protein RsbU (phosphoserine phosphatase)